MSSSSRKRKLGSASTSLATAANEASPSGSKASLNRPGHADNGDEDEEVTYLGTQKVSRTPKRAKQENEPDGSPSEKRLKRFRSQPPQAFYTIYERATSQRFYILSRSRCGTADCPEERVEITGSTGNIYEVHIGRQPSCTCPHARKGNQCKHQIYVLSRVLHAKFDFVYQQALLSSELCSIFAKAPPIEVGDDAESSADLDPNRKPVEGDCPICFTAFEAEATVYCKAQCGQNIHKECFEMWASTKRRSANGKVTCPMCRTPWLGDDDLVKRVQKNEAVNSEGYLNVADQLGISTRRDSSTYHRRNWRGWLRGGRRGG